MPSPAPHKTRLFLSGLIGVAALTGLFLLTGCRPAPPTAKTASVAPQSTASPVLRYAIFPAPPYMIDADNPQVTPTGIDVDIVQKIAQTMDVPVEFIRCPWARCLELMQTGQADILSSVYKKPEREQFLWYFDEPYLTELPIAFYY